MKRGILILFSALLLAVSCGTTGKYGQFYDGVYRKSIAASQPEQVILLTEGEIEAAAAENISFERLCRQDTVVVRYVDVYPGDFWWDMYFSPFPLMATSFAYNWGWDRWYWNRWHNAWLWGPYNVFWNSPSFWGYGHYGYHGWGGPYHPGAFVGRDTYYGPRSTVQGAGGSRFTHGGASHRPSVGGASYSGVSVRRSSSVVSGASSVRSTSSTGYSRGATSTGGTSSGGYSRGTSNTRSSSSSGYTRGTAGTGSSSSRGSSYSGSRGGYSGSSSSGGGSFGGGSFGGGGSHGGGGGSHGGGGRR